MDWSIFWTAVAAIGQASAAGITVWAVIVALRQGKIGRKEFLQARYDDARPILIVTSDSQSIETPLDWFLSHRKLEICNVGKGVALHIRSVIYGPEPTAGSQSPSLLSVPNRSANDTHWYYWNADAIRAEEKRELDHQREDPGAGSNRFASKNMHIQKHSFYAQGHGATHICRISLTYHDIFHRKHASIFDFVPNAGWQEVDTLEEIPQDLRDLELH